MKQTWTVLSRGWIVLVILGSLIFSGIEIPGRARASYLSSTTLVSINAEGEQANANSSNPVISADGRFILFISGASNLVSGYSGGLFVRDRVTGQVTVVSIASDGTPANASVWAADISSNGRFVAFMTTATNLVPGVTPWENIYVHDRDADEDGIYDEPGEISTVLATVNSSGVPGANAGFCYVPASPTISADGRYVAYHSCYSNLVEGDTNNSSDVFVHDIQTGQTILVSVDSEGGQADGASFSAISGNGRFIVFYAGGSLGGIEFPDATQVYVHDRDFDGNDIFDEPSGIRTSLVSISSEGTPGNANTYGGWLFISSDGRYAAYSSPSSNLVPNDTNGYRDGFIHDLQSGNTRRISVSTEGAQANDNSFITSISADGRYIVFSSSATNLVDDDTNGVDDVFLHDQLTGVTSRVSLTFEELEGNGSSGHGTISQDGALIAFSSSATNLTPDDHRNTFDIFLREKALNEVTISGPSTGGVNQDTVFTAVISSASGDLPITYVWKVDGQEVARHEDVEGFFNRVTINRADAGMKTISVTATWGTESFTDTHAILLYGPPEADFSADFTSGVAPLPVEFTNTSTGNFSTSFWDFGDGQPSFGLWHTYYDPGVYTVSLTVTGIGGTDTEIKVNYITVYAPVQANFSVDHTTGITPLAVQFSNTTSGEADTWSWNFGDGSTSTEENPSHTYLTPGSYTVSLVSSGLGGMSTKTCEDCIQVFTLVQAGFAVSKSSGTAPLAVDFTSSASGDFDTLTWDFGDGSAVGIGSAVSHTYPSKGTYTVTLTASGPGGTQTATQTIRVYAPVQADFSASPVTGTAPLLVDFSDLSLGDYTSCQWDFGDGSNSTDAHPVHLYGAPGTYTVSLTVNGPGGTHTKTCTDCIIVNTPKYSLYIPLATK